MAQVILSLISGLIGAVVGGALTVWGSLKTLNMTMSNLERAEIRRMKVECVVNLAGLRFIFSEARPGLVPIPADAEIVKLMFELNRIPILWADDAEVLKAVHDFHAEPTNKDRLFAIIRRTANTTSLHTSNLADADINAVFQLSRPVQAPVNPPQH